MSTQLAATIIIGVQCSGKSTYCRQFVKNNPNYQHINRDDIRNMFFPDDIIWDNTFGQESRIAEIENIGIDITINLGRNVVIDEGFHCFKSIREKTLKHLHTNYPNIRCTAVVVLCSLSDAIIKNDRRVGKARVPEKTIKHFYKGLISGVGGSLNPWDIIETLTEEGFDDVKILFN